MGHIRIGFLPRTKQWNNIIEQLSKFDGSFDDIQNISYATLNSIRNLYDELHLDESIQKSINFLAIIVNSAKQDNQIEYLKNHGYAIDNNMSLFSIIESVKNLINTENGSLEINKMAKDAIMHSIASYYNSHTQTQLSLLGDKNKSPIQNLNGGSSFCEMARSFFAEFTSRQIKYYLERSAADAINDYNKLSIFTNGINSNLNTIADHAFDISNIMQSFAAGWFNKHAITSSPNQEQITNFLRISFNKMREELRREVEGE
jgi:hypothetical protein